MPAPSTRASDMVPHSGLAADTSTAMSLDMDDLSAPQLSASRDPSQPSLIHPPEPLPIHDDDNPDAMALRAAISVLQLQKDKARRDLQSLQLLKRAAAERPEPFLRQLLAGKLQPALVSDDPLHATFDSDDHDDDEVNDDEEEEEEEEEGEGEEVDNNGNGEAASKAQESLTFPRLPAMQSIFRCPPINWAKYHVIGEALDKMHEEQLNRPGPSTASRSVAAPYSPFLDHSEGQATTQPAIFPP